MTVNQFSRGRHLKSIVAYVDVTLENSMAVNTICEMLCEKEFLKLDLRDKQKKLLRHHATSIVTFTSND